MLQRVFIHTFPYTSVSVLHSNTPRTNKTFIRPYLVSNSSFSFLGFFLLFFVLFCKSVTKTKQTFCYSYPVHRYHSWEDTCWALDKSSSRYLQRKFRTLLSNQSALTSRHQEPVCFVLLTFIRWRAIYPVNSVYQLFEELLPGEIDFKRGLSIIF